MIGMVIIFYFVVGLYFVGIASFGPADNLKDEDYILYLKVIIYILLLWPVCLFEAWRDHDNDDEEDTVEAWRDHDNDDEEDTDL